nr:hypothetical protein [Tanacetum cinerariifolium]
MTDHEVAEVGPSTKVSLPLAIVFEKETLKTTLEAKLPAIFCMAGIIVPVDKVPRSRLISKASSFCTMSIFAVLKVGIPIFTRMTASVPYVSENGVSSLLELIM